MALSAQSLDSTPPAFAELRSIIREASSWEELAKRLSNHSVTLEQSDPRKVELRSGDLELPWPAGTDPKELSQRFGEPFSAFQEREEARQRIAKGLETLRRSDSWDEAHKGLRTQGLRLARDSGSPAIATDRHKEPIPKDVLTQMESRLRHSFEDWRQGLPQRTGPAELKPHLEQASSWNDLTARFAEDRLQWDFDPADRSLLVFDEHSRRIDLPDAPQLPQLEERFGEPFRTAPLDDRRREDLESAFQDASKWPELSQRLDDLGIRLQVSEDARSFRLVDRDSGLPLPTDENGLHMPSAQELEKRIGPLPAWSQEVASVQAAADELARTMETRERLEAEQSRAAGLARDLESRADHSERLQSQLAEAEAAYPAHLAEVYRPAELPKAQAAIESHLGQNGHRVTAEALRDRPQRFGKLLGRGGPFANDQRREAQAAAQFAGTRLRSLHELRLRLSALPTPPDRAAVQAARQTYERVSQHLRTLPSRKQMVEKVNATVHAAGGLPMVAGGLSQVALQMATATVARASSVVVQEAER